jgi:hypothetical protein
VSKSDGMAIPLLFAVKWKWWLLDIKLQLHWNVHSIEILLWYAEHEDNKQ